MIAIAAIVIAKGVHSRNIADNGETQIAHGFYSILIFSEELLEVFPPERRFVFLLFIATGMVKPVRYDL
jgi:hypothetical protein